MADARSLKLVTGSAEAPRARPVRVARPCARILSVGGGKGGIGKSLVATNLAIELSRRGEKVVLVDADLGGANLHTGLGLEPPKRTLQDFLEGRARHIEEVLTPTGLPNLALVSGAIDRVDTAHPKYAQKARLLKSLGALQAAQVLDDLGAGTHLDDGIAHESEHAGPAVGEALAVHQQRRLVEAQSAARSTREERAGGCRRRGGPAQGVAAGSGRRM